MNDTLFTDHIPFTWLSESLLKTQKESSSEKNKVKNLLKQSKNVFVKTCL